PKLVATRNGAEIVRTGADPAVKSSPDAATARSTRAVPTTRRSVGEYTAWVTSPTDSSSATPTGVPGAGTSAVPSSPHQQTGSRPDPSFARSRSAATPVN